jgi:hypothetical protein
MIENFDSLARLLLEALLNTLWQGTLIAVLVWLLLRFVKRVSATTRHAVWLVTLLTIGALPSENGSDDRWASGARVGVEVWREGGGATFTGVAGPGAG